MCLKDLSEFISSLRSVYSALGRAQHWTRAAKILKKTGETDLLSMMDSIIDAVPGVHAQVGDVLDKARILQKAKQDAKLRKDRRQDKSKKDMTLIGLQQIAELLHANLPVCGDLQFMLFEKTNRYAVSLFRHCFVWIATLCRHTLVDTAKYLEVDRSSCAYRRKCMCDRLATKDKEAIQAIMILHKVPEFQAIIEQHCASLINL